MNWLITTLGTSIGKKLLMAVTGLGFICFLLVHLAGNLTIYGGMDAFNTYSEHLHALGPLINIAELGLLTLALVHVSIGIILFLSKPQGPIIPLCHECPGRGTYHRLGDHAVYRFDYPVVCHFPSGSVPFCR